MYYGGTNQETKEQRSRKLEKEEQEKWEKTTLQSKRVCKKKDLISSKERLQPSKFLAFLSRQMHQIKQWGTNFQTSMWRCRANFPCQASNNSRTVWGITHWIPTSRKPKTTTPKLWNNEVEDDPPTPHTSYTYSTSQALSLVFYEGYLLLRSYLRKQTKKRKLPLEEPSIAISFSMERKQD